MHILRTQLFSKLFLGTFVPCVLSFLLFSQTITSAQDTETTVTQMMESDNYSGAANQYYSYALNLFEESKYSESIIYLKKALKLYEDNNNTKASTAICYTIGATYSNLEEYQSAEEYVRKGIAYDKTNADKKSLAEGYSNLGSILQNSGRLAEATLELEKAKELFLELQDTEHLGKIYIALYTSYEAIGDMEKATKYFELYSAIDKKVKQEEIEKIQSGAEFQVKQAITSKNIAEKQLSKTEEELAQTTDTLKKAKKLTIEQQLSLALKEAKIRETETLLNIEQLRRSRYAIAFISVLLVLVIIAFFAFRLKIAHKKINEQKTILEIQNRNIRSSLDYAHMIQNILLPSVKDIGEAFENFVVFYPKDIVSGDFYWHAKIDEATDYFALADCTGHGVPGALMSMIGHRLLNEIVMERKEAVPANILELLDKGIQLTLKQEETHNRDGMEIAIFSIAKQPDGTSTITYAGAKRPLYLIRDNSTMIEEIEPDRRSIGGAKRKKKKPFTTKQLTLKKGDTLYTTSDGIIDQNDSQRQKFGSNRLKKHLQDNASLPIAEQGVAIEKALKKHMENEEQRDDICLLGIKI